VIREVKRRNQIAVLLTIIFTLIASILIVWVFGKIMNLTPDFR
jgi:amino acid transporter